MELKRKSRNLRGFSFNFGEIEEEYLTESWPWDEPQHVRYIEDFATREGKLCAQLFC